MVTIAIPTYNQEETIEMAIDSAIAQDYPNKEIMVVDDASTDRTALYAQIKGIRVIVNDVNLGIGRNLTRCMWEARGRVIIYLCGDDYFADRRVVSDMMEIFDGDPRVGVIGRPYYQFMNGYKGAINRVEGNILVTSSNPSGIGFRKCAMNGVFGNRIFIETPYMVKKVLAAGWGYQIMDYDTVAVRIHPGGNTATVSSYYNESPTKVLNSIVPGYVFYEGFINLKMRCPHILLEDIWATIQARPLCIFNPKFWMYAILAIITPGRILRPLSMWYRHRIKRRFCDIKSRSRQESTER